MIQPLSDLAKTIITSHLRIFLETVKQKKVPQKLNVVGKRLSSLQTGQELALSELQDSLEFEVRFAAP